MPIYQFQYQEFLDESLLPMEWLDLLEAARAGLRDAYAPYSKFHVSASIRMQGGEVVKGVNIENASYPVGICAERSALASAISQFPNQRIEAIAITYASVAGQDDQPAFPCGMCRQFISECEDRNKQDIPLLLAGRVGRIVIVDTVKHLLPFSFSGNDLGAIR